MDLIADLEAFLMGLPQFFRFRFYDDMTILGTIDPLLRMKWEQFLHQHMVTKLPVQAVLIPAFINDSIGALPDDLFDMAGHTLKGENCMKFQWCTVIHERFLLFLFSRHKNTS